LNAAKSFVSDGAAITLVRIKPSKSEAFQTVTTDKFLDWQYTNTVDVDATNNKLDFSIVSVSAGAPLVATLTTGNYTLLALTAELVAKMDLAIMGAGGGAFITVEVSGDKFILGSSSAMTLAIESGANAAVSIYPHIGFTGEDLTGLVEYTGALVETVEKVISLEVTSGSATTITRAIAILSEARDMLYSTDARLAVHEPDILQYVFQGRATFKNVHRRAQELVLAWLDKEGFVDVYDNKYTKASLVLTEELQEWGTFLALRLIYEGISNAIDDVFDRKAKKYKGMEVEHRARAVLRLDVDGDGESAIGEQIDIRSGIVVRR
jgi:hypothetical protein